MNFKKQLHRYVKNPIEARILKAKGGTGLLSHIKDDRDREASLGWFQAKPQREQFSVFNGEIINQNPQNICVFASRMMGRWYQQGIRFSMKWDIAWAYRNGWINSNGFSSLRAENKLGENVGLIPYEFLPDEDRGWPSLAKLDNTTYNNLLVEAKNIKIPEYRKVKNLQAAYEALDKGYVLFTGIKWYTGDNNPQPPAYILKHNGAYVGGHAINVSGYKDVLFENPQTFGKSYGKDGVAWLEQLFGSNNYAVYVEEFIDLDTRVEVFKRQNEGKMVRTQDDIRCFVIKDGKKCHVKGDDQMKTYFKVFEKVGLTYVKQELLDAIPEGKTYPYAT